MQQRMLATKQGNHNTEMKLQHLQHLQEKIRKEITSNNSYNSKLMKQLFSDVFHTLLSIKYSDSVVVDQLHAKLYRADGSKEEI
jgi:D-hexose-6-phosphate mutarotase